MYIGPTARKELWPAVGRASGDPADPSDPVIHRGDPPDQEGGYARSDSDGSSDRQV
jgi:hypothetical protein